MHDFAKPLLQISVNKAIFSDMTHNASQRPTAVLGPTNTGKTHLAIERMLGYRNGMIGFPLRLLAREVYDRVVRLKGERQVALVTGEEKIVPPTARYFLCTTESMPLDRPVEFLAIDEIQLAADPERGHIFTDRLLHARGQSETMFLGSDTARPAIRRLVPDAEYLSRPRLSQLSYAGHKKITRLPRRSAAVAFSATDVYAAAELIRRQRGGTAVVLGALSPRTRNAQVAMFEAGEVDYLVATDAIGMGLNLNLAHVAFVRLKKFDGHHHRDLTAAEIGQIAGRAGRHQSNGTFGTTGNLDGMSAELVEAVEEHRFDPLRVLFWRNSSLDFRSADALVKSLEEPPPSALLVRTRHADDHRALVRLLRDPDLWPRVRGEEAVSLLWEVCQVPDFRQVQSDQHARFLARLYDHLMSRSRLLPEDWVADQIARIGRTEGEIETLAGRIAEIRTWTYITYRSDWLADATHWQGRARAIEDLLSDALHERLTERFVDRRTAHLVSRMARGEKLLGAVRRNGDVLVEGQYVGRLEGFRFTLDTNTRSEDARAILSAARSALQQEIPARIRRLEKADDGAFQLDSQANLLWETSPVARLVPGPSPWAPQLRMLDSDFLDAAAQERLRRRLAQWLEQHLARLSDPLTAPLDHLPAGPARGLVFQLTQSLGCLPRSALREPLRLIGRAERKALASWGVRLGRESVWMETALKKTTMPMRTLLWRLYRDQLDLQVPDRVGASFIPDEAIDEAACLALGYRFFAGEGNRIAVRVDALERLSREAFKLAKQGPFVTTDRLSGLARCDDEDLGVILTAIGYRQEQDKGVRTYTRASNGGRRAGKGAKRRSTKKAQRHNRAQPNPCSPFAKLRHLMASS